MTKNTKPQKDLGEAELNEAPINEEIQADEEESVEQEAPKTKKTKEKGSDESVDILRNGQEYIRTYSKEVHGEEYKDHASSLVSKDGKYSIVPSKDIKEVCVEWREEEKNDAGILLGYKQKQKNFTDKAQALLFKNEVKGVCKIIRK